MITIALFILFCIAHAWEHAHDATVNHYRATWTRISVGGITFWSLFSSYNYDLINGVIFILLILALFWNVFDISRNIFTGEHWLYIGRTASFDKWGRAYTAPYYFMKLFSIISGIGLFLQYNGYL